MDNDTIIKMVKAGLSDDIVVVSINSKPGAYDTSTDGLVALKSAGVSDRIVGALITHVNVSTTQSPASVDAPEAASPQTPATPTVESDPGTAKGNGTIPTGARIVVAPMGGFETYFAAAVREKKVPVKLTLDKASAQFFVVSTNNEWQGFVYGAGGSSSWNALGGSSSHGAAASSTRGLEASIMVIDAKSKDIVWAYEVHKSSHGSILFGTLGARGQQSIAEACAKHLKEYIDKGK
jgi:hypothetical protein